jgi:hypothetical protein
MMMKRITAFIHENIYQKSCNIKWATKKPKQAKKEKGEQQEVKRPDYFLVSRKCNPIPYFIYLGKCANLSSLHSFSIITNFLKMSNG